jgi:hypothetical protein
MRMSFLTTAIQVFISLHSQTLIPSILKLFFLEPEFENLQRDITQPTKEELLLQCIDLIPYRKNQFFSIFRDLAASSESPESKFTHILILTHFFQSVILGVDYLKRNM